MGQTAGMLPSQVLEYYWPDDAMYGFEAYSFDLYITQLVEDDKPTGKAGSGGGSSTPQTRGNRLRQQLRRKQWAQGRGSTGSTARW